MVSEMISSSGSRLGYLGEHKMLSSMVLAQTLPLCCLVSPQGSVLGPILFLIFINDLPDNMNSTVRLFADECVLYRNIRSEDQHIHQDDFNKLAQWEEAWLIKFNVAKCHSMRVTKHSLPKQIIHDYSLHNQVLENVPSAKYLGITITDDLVWGKHINNVTSKVTKKLFFFPPKLDPGSKGNQGCCIQSFGPSPIRGFSTYMEPPSPNRN